MKNTPNSSILLIFAICLILGLAGGLWTGRAFGAGQASPALDLQQPGEEPEASPAPTAAALSSTAQAAPVAAKQDITSEEARRPVPELATAPNGQRNLLVLVVDDLKHKNPSLRSAWLVLYLPPSPRLTLAPIYPAVLQNPQPEPDAALAAAFDISPAGVLSPNFVQALEEYDIWWSQYIVLDATSLALLIDLSGGIDLGSGTQTGAQALASLQDKSGLDQLTSQADLVYALCYHTPDAEKIPLDPTHLLKTLGPRVKTDLSLVQMAGDWQNIVLSNGRQCRFPTLNFQPGAQLP
jgi:hypothetical protein